MVIRLEHFQAATAGQLNFFAEMFDANRLLNDSDGALAKRFHGERGREMTGNQHGGSGPTNLVSVADEIHAVVIANVQVSDDASRSIDFQLRLKLPDASEC